MDLLYEKEKEYIGIIKFYDTKKGFGYIASNNCNMSSQKYKQDFYVNSESFIEREAKREGQIVVFQVEKQEDEKKRAVNVRNITKSDKDIQLALSYYGDHELIYIDEKRINLFNRIHIPLNLVAEKVRFLIEDDPKRSPKRALNTFKFFVEHYQTRFSSFDGYNNIFDVHFSTENKKTWDALLSILNNEERHELLKTYPTIVRYFDDVNLINEWAQDILTENVSLAKLIFLNDIFKYLPNECVEIAKQRIETISDVKIKGILEKISKRYDIFEEDIIPSKERRLRIHPSTYDNDKERNDIIYELKKYLSFTSRNYQKEINDCLKSVNNNLFSKKLSTFLTYTMHAYDIYKDEFLVYIENLPQKELSAHIEEIKNELSPVIEHYIEEHNYRMAVYFIDNLPMLGEKYLNSFKKKLFPLINNKLQEEIKECTDDINKLHSFLSDYSALTSIYNDSEKESIKQLFIPVLKETKSLRVLSEMAFGHYKWLSLNEFLILAKQIVSSWDYKSLNAFVNSYSNSEFYEDKLCFFNFIIERAIEIIGNIPLNYFFDGTAREVGLENSRFPEKENCDFLIKLKNFIPEGQNSKEWESYLSGRTTEDLLILYDNKVIYSLPEDIIGSIIDSITLDDLYTESHHWYNVPSLKNYSLTKILKETKADLFSLIADRLLSMNLDKDNIPLAVLLAELMTANRPEDEDFNNSRDWGSNFTAHLQSFKRNNSLSPILDVILWAVHSKTTTSSTALSEIFSSLPPYLQIKIVKKLFKTISEGKINHTADSLYKLVSHDGQNNICFPLEIAFRYLILREKDPSMTLNNNIILQLLEGRDDTDEWIGIRSIVTPCIGRWTTKELPDDRSNWRRNSYFNGIIKKEAFQGQNNKIKVFIPNKMVDEYEQIKNYNNKYYTQSLNLIHLTYKEDEYIKLYGQDGVSFYFDETYEAELFSIARRFNFKFNSLDNYLDFETKRDDQETFCECRMSDKVDNYYHIAFYWCGNKPCFRPPIKYCLNHEWERYTILDFMRILNISTDYVNKNGKRTKFGHYIILSSYLKSFAKFYDHLKCRKCGKLMKPRDITNFTSRAVTEFSCTNEQCSECKNGNIIYLNHCFNKQKCNATIDSRDSKKCPNGQYICPECGACCSTENFRLRISNLEMTGGYISDRLVNFVHNNLGHWEKNELYCCKCGKPMTNNQCAECGYEYTNRP